MKYHCLWAALLPLLFFLGFLSGTLWQTLMIRNMLQSVFLQPPVVETQPRSVPDAADQVKMQPQTSDEEKMEKALEDPDFKRVHDFLMRENPIQMDLTSPHNSEQKANHDD